ncbi:DUF4157 domain-containing protein [Microbacterium sp. SS28]|uniref:eCIS core domain-containing protein n=1 Tax=Microbacterium sp. SS28 TaxID=2919948 RepID=UPI001FA94FA7|nr:DUF4157 domain-containing protein [Microbacterium sp. SS28]
MSLAHAHPATPAPERPSGIHAVGRADAPAERAADRFAEAAVAPAAAAGWSFAAVPPRAPSEAATVDVRLDGEGRALDARERAEAPQGLDPDAVRVHTDPAAQDTAERAGAAALTVGTRIAFARGREQRGTEPGRRLLAHELAHAAQQRGGAHTIVRRQPVAPVTPVTTLMGLPEADRKRIKVVTESQVTVPGIATSFDPNAVPYTPPAATTIAIDPSASGVQPKGLQNIVGQLLDATVLPGNTTITLRLALAKYGGIDGLYRFTHHAPPPAAKATATTRVLVEQLGAAVAPPDQAVPGPPEPGKDPPADPVADKIKDAGLVHSLTGDQLDALRGAVSRLPGSHLALVKGLTIVVGSPPAGEDGEYDAKTHTVTIRKSAFDKSDVRFLGRGNVLSYASEVILHEIGHAVDDADLRKAMAAYSAAGKAQTDTLAANADAKGSYPKGGPEEKAIKAAEQATKTARDALAATKSRSGSTVTFQGGTADVDEKGGAAGKAFREASKKDGIAVSEYGTTAWKENYAEAYALYISSPELLQALRPATFAHLAATLPK